MHFRSVWGAKGVWIFGHFRQTFRLCLWLAWGALPSSHAAAPRNRSSWKQSPSRAPFWPPKEGVSGRATNLYLPHPEAQRRSLPKLSTQLRIAAGLIYLSTLFTWLSLIILYHFFIASPSFPYRIGSVGFLSQFVPILV